MAETHSMTQHYQARKASGERLAFIGMILLLLACISLITIILGGTGGVQFLLWVRIILTIIFTPLGIFLGFKGQLIYWQAKNDLEQGKKPNH